MSHSKLPQPDANQVDRFKELARELGCDEDEAAFEAALKKVAEAKPSHGSGKKEQTRLGKSE